MQEDTERNKGRRNRDAERKGEDVDSRNKVVANRRRSRKPLLLAIQNRTETQPEADGAERRKEGDGRRFGNNRTPHVLWNDSKITAGSHEQAHPALVFTLSTSGR